MSEKCFALRVGGACGALRGSCMGTAGCPFYKTKRQQAADQQRANARLKRLPFDQQQYISEKYFSGEMLWRGEGE